MRFEIRLGDADRDKYGGDEWLEFDPSVYDDMPLAQQAALERQMIAGGGVSLYQLLRPGGQINRETAIGRTSVAWLARQQAGLVEPTFEKFVINHLDVKPRLDGGPVVPLDGASPAPGETTPDSVKPSETAPSRKRSRSSSLR